MNIKKGQNILLFDGICNLCSVVVLFILRRDPKLKFRFASLQSETGQSLLKQHNLPLENNGTFVFIANGVVYTKSTAVLQVAKRLNGLWPIPFYIFILVPPIIRDGIYSYVARNRYRWFGVKQECLLPTPEIKSQRGQNR
ncbi:MAG TPA: DCC1-like thiol-disulfide oxidoreductase family protein [Bacilli bacterium]